MGRFFSANLWGMFIDKYGRKSGLLIILFALTLCTLAFGFCTSYWAAIVIRFITGFFNGLSIVAKTISMEVCTDDLKSWSISVTNSIWSLGTITGPIFGSLLYKSIDSFPILGSAIAVGLVGALLLPLCYYYIDETLPAKAPQHTNQHQRLPNDDKDIEMHSRDDSSELLNHPPKSDSVLAVPNVAKLITVFSFSTFFATVFGGLIIFWVSAKYEDGGLDFEYKQISHIFMYFTAPQILMQILGYPLIQKKVGDYAMLNWGHLVQIPVFLLIPFAHAFGKGAFTEQKIYIVFWLFIRNMASFMNFSALQRFTNDVVSADKRGRMNGIQVTCSSGLQILGPFLGKWLLSWSMTNGMGYPFDYHFVFLLMCIITMGILSVIYSLKFTDESKKKLIGENTAH